MIPQESVNIENDNGLVLSGHQLPQEMLIKILCSADYNTLLNCELVCERWKTLIRRYVWRKKVEISLGRPLRFGHEVSWEVYRQICRKKPFERNLIRNHSGEEGINRHWQIILDISPHTRWWVEQAPAGCAQLPHDGYGQFCFLTPYGGSTKFQIIDLPTEGLTPYILDNLQPTIQVNEWYSSLSDSRAVYNCTVTLLNENRTSIRRFDFHDDIDAGQQRRWRYFTHDLRDYGPGLRQIYFEHGGIDNMLWTGGYGIKMTGASVRLL